MTLVTLIVVITLVVAFVYVAQHVPQPWNWLLYGIAAVVLLVAIIKVLGVDMAISKAEPVCVVRGL